MYRYCCEALILIAVLGCSNQKIIKNEPVPSQDVVINGFEKLGKTGFHFKWKFYRRGFRYTSNVNFEAEGNYFNADSIEINGILTIDGMKEIVNKGVNPLMAIQKIFGFDDFHFIKRERDKLIFGFTPDLSFLLPDEKNENGLIWIQEGTIKKIVSRNTKVRWEMEIRPLHSLNFIKVYFQGDSIPKEKIIERLKFFRLNTINWNGNNLLIKDADKIPNLFEKIFDKGEIKFYYATPGKGKDYIYVDYTTLISFKLEYEINLKVLSVNIIPNIDGKPLLKICVDESGLPSTGAILLYNDGKLISYAFLGMGGILKFPFSDYPSAKVIAGYIKTGPLPFRIKNYKVVSEK